MKKTQKKHVMLTVIVLFFDNYTIFQIAGKTNRVSYELSKRSRKSLSVKTSNIPQRFMVVERESSNKVVEKKESSNKSVVATGTKRRSGSKSKQPEQNSDDDTQAGNYNLQLNHF